MSLRVRERLVLADAVTLVNAGLGVVGAVVAASDPTLAARFILVAAIADALDGILARAGEASEVGPLLDSITDVVSFGATPALFLFYGASGAGTDPLAVGTPTVIAALLVASVFVAFSVLRTAFYTVYVGESEDRPGIQNTLAATILAAAYLGGLTTAWPLLAAGVAVSIAMVAPVPLPKLRARDATVVGVVQAAAVVAPNAYMRLFPRALLVAALAYAALGPWYYWGE